VDDAERRVALNQTIFRAGNEALLTNADPSLAQVPFMCECADEGCLEVLRLDRDAYERVRGHPRRFVVLPGHEGNGGEPMHVVEEEREFVVLEKEGEAGALAERHDPRGRPRTRA
jgi:hypothetical protein